MECKNCNYRIFQEPRYSGWLGRYYCAHPGARSEGKGIRSKNFICGGSADNITIKTSPRWCPLKGCDKLNERYAKLIIAAFNSESFDPIKNSQYLNDIEKKIILRSYRDNKSVRQIATELEISVMRVRRIKDEAMDRVRLTLYKNSMQGNMGLLLGNSDYVLAKELSVRSRNLLKNNNLYTIDEIVKYIKNQNTPKPEEALLNLHNTGKKLAKEICDFLRDKGFLQD